MKFRPLLLITLVLILCTAAIATADTQTLNAPFRTDAGLISIAPLLPTADTASSIMVDLSIPAALLDGMENPTQYLQDSFLLVSLNGVWHPDRIKGLELTDGQALYRLSFAVPDGADRAAYRLLYGDQLRALELTSAEAALLMQQEIDAQQVLPTP